MTERRILLLITDLELGGTPTVVRELAIRLSPYAHVEVACLKPMGPIGDQLREREIAVTSFDAHRTLDFRKTVGRLVDLVRERQINVVFSFLVHANVVAWRAARRLPDVRMLQSIQTAQPRPRWHWVAQRFAQRAASRVIVPSESVALRAIERSGVPREKLVVIPNAIDADAFRGTGVTPVSRTLDDATFRVGFVGRLDPVKRIGDLIAAIGQMRASVQLDVYGEGAQRDSLAHTIETSMLGDRVTLHGSIADPREAYSAIDALVLPSEAEGFGLVLIEAMAAGVPVIGTDVDGIRDVVAHERTGLLVPVADPSAIATAIARLRDDTALRERLIAAAREEVARRFAWPSVIARYRDVLQV